QASQKPKEQKTKLKSEQQSLFGESQQSEESEPVDRQAESLKAGEKGSIADEKRSESSAKQSGREFGVGETIELEL
ncbi:MAG TPA: hypothetical protein VFZ52_03070, partial [Chryseolinea sp.]